MTKSRKRAKGGNRMRQLGKVPITIWVTPQQKKDITDCAEGRREKTAAFVKQSALNRVTDLNRVNLYR